MWWKNHKGKITAVVVSTLAYLVLTGALHLPPAMAKPVADAMAAAAVNMVTDETATGSTHDAGN